MRRLLPLTIIAALFASCTHVHNTAYTSLDNARRDTALADRLNQEGADLMATEPAKAETLFREALAADLYHGPAHNNLGVLFLGRNKLYEAAGEFEWARKLLPGHPDPRLNLSLTLESAGRFDQAADHARIALQIHPGHIASLQQIARLERLHPPHPPGTSPDPAATEEVRNRLHEIALRGESDAWKDWARLQLVKLDGKR